MKTTATMTVLLFAATLSLHAQTTPTPTYSQNQPSANANETAQQRREREEREKNEQANPRFTLKEPAAYSHNSDSTELKYRTAQPTEVQKNSASTTHPTTAQTGVDTRTHVAVTREVETEVRTVVQQIDAQGPVVVERISTQFADVTCTEENARALVVGLNNGTSVTLRGEDGQTATFTPTVRLGYGDAYIAMSLAVQALRDAGITGCASPAQWQAVLLGGDLGGGTVRTTSVTTERFPGILVLHSQGGWTKVAQTTHVELSQVVSQANTHLQINSSSQQNLSPVGRPRDYDPRAEGKQEQEETGKEKADKWKKDYNLDQSQNPDEVTSPDMETPPETPPKY